MYTGFIFISLIYSFFCRGGVGIINKGQIWESKFHSIENYIGKVVSKSDRNQNQ